MTYRRTIAGFLGLVPLCLMEGCAGGLLGGGKPDALYRFGASEVPALSASPLAAQQMLLLETVRFAPEIDGDRMLAVHGGSARYIKGSRWVTSGPSLFTQAMFRRLRSGTSGFQTVKAQSGGSTGFSLMVGIARFEAAYDDPAMTHRPSIYVEGDATLSRFPDRKLVAQRHFVVRMPAAQNRAADIVAAFDRATTCYTDDVAQWVASSAAGRTAAPEPSACVAVP